MIVQDELTLVEAAFKMNLDCQEIMASLEANKKSKGEGLPFVHNGKKYELVIRRIREQ